jgi:hypothetical protein
MQVMAAQAAAQVSVEQAEQLHLGKVLQAAMVNLLLLLLTPAVLAEVLVRQVCMMAQAELACHPHCLVLLFFTQAVVAQLTLTP